MDSVPRKRKTNILFIHQEMGVGGAEELRSVLINNINKEKFSVSLCCIGKIGEIGQELSDKGFCIRALKKGWGLHNIFSIFALLKIIKQCKPDIVHTCLFYANFHGRIAAKIAGVPIIIAEEQNVDKWKKRYLIFLFIDWLLSKITDRIIACSQAVKDFIAENEKITTKKLLFISNAFDLNKFINHSSADKEKVKGSFGLNNGDRIIGTIGSLSLRKGHIYLIKAMKEIVLEEPSCKLLMIGAGPLEKDLRKEVDWLGLARQIIFTGLQRDIFNLLSILEILILPSLWEGLPLVTLEAMAMAKPVIASRIPGVTEVVIDGENGTLVPPRDSRLLAKAILDLLKDTNRCKRMGELGKARVLRYYNPQSYVSKMETLYETLSCGKRLNI